MRSRKRRPVKTSLADKRRNQILVAAVEIFSKYGFYEAEVETIAKAAGISKGTVYNYFDDKRELFMAAIEWGIALLAERIAASQPRGADPARKLEAAMQAYLAFFQNNRHLFRIIFLQRSVFRDKAELRLSKKYLAHFYLFEDILTEGIERRSFKEVDVRVASYAIVGMIQALYHQWLLGGESTKLEGNVSPIKELVFEGLAAGQSKRESDVALPA